MAPAGGPAGANPLRQLILQMLMAKLAGAKPSGASAAAAAPARATGRGGGGATPPGGGTGNLNQPGASESEEEKGQSTRAIAARGKAGRPIRRI